MSGPTPAHKEVVLHITIALFQYFNVQSSFRCMHAHSRMKLPLIRLFLVLLTPKYLLPTASLYTAIVYASTPFPIIGDYNYYTHGLK